MWNLRANCKNLENSEHVWKSFTGPSATALSRGYTTSFAAASDPKQLAGWVIKMWCISCDPSNFWDSQALASFAKERAELWAANASVFGSELFALSSAKASCWRQVSSFSMFLHGVFLSSRCLIAVFPSHHSNFHLYKHSLHLKGRSSKEDLQACENHFLEIIV